MKRMAQEQRRNSVDRSLPARVRVQTNLKSGLMGLVSV